MGETRCWQGHLIVATALTSAYPRRLNSVRSGCHWELAPEGPADTTAPQATAHTHTCVQEGASRAAVARTSPLTLALPGAHKPTPARPARTHVRTLAWAPGAPTDSRQRLEAAMCRVPSSMQVAAAATAASASARGRVLVGAHCWGQKWVWEEERLEGCAAAGARKARSRPHRA